MIQKFYENTRKEMGKIMKKKVKIMILVLVIFLIYIVVGMLIPFMHRQSVSEEYKNQIKISDFYGDSLKNGPDRAKIIENNQEALNLRLSMIQRAKKEIILSTFDIREGSSTTDIFSALVVAAKRGVKVKILVDGLYGTLHMNGKDIFQAVGSESNIEIRFYNTPNLLKPWTIHGCLHDKYLITDHQYLLMGGRNTFDYFLKNRENGSMGLDREILIYNTGKESESAVGQVKTYFRKIWKLDVCKTKFDRWSKEKRAAEIQRLIEHEKQLDVPGIDYEKETVSTKKATLVTNPTHIYGKEPYVWETMKQLMLNADKRVLIHTPYAVFSDEMYEGMAQIHEKIPNTKIILNSIASGDNICASADYMKNKQNIVDTGAEIYEYMGKHSTHGKSLVIDDDIAVVGSYNFDCRSTYVDTEAMLVVHGKEITEQLEEKLNALKNDALAVDGQGKYIKNGDTKERILDKDKGRLIRILSYVIQGFRYLV